VPIKKVCIGTRRKVTENPFLKLTEQIICADKCKGVTLATNRGFSLRQDFGVFLSGKRDTHG
ncbi:MAG: hypothetical protein K2N52_00885, partial [Clostridia bacterium]|nr:hypothetical protein [Clostridia bacterium]